MQKTASEIADIVLEKLAVSPALARKVLMRKAQRRMAKDLPNTVQSPDVLLDYAQDVMQKSPLAAKRGYGVHQPMEIFDAQPLATHAANRAGIPKNMRIGGRQGGGYTEEQYVKMLADRKARAIPEGVLPGAGGVSAEAINEKYIANGMIPPYL